MQPRRFSHPMLRGASVALVGVIALLAACEAKMPTAADVAKMDARSGESAAWSMGLAGDSSLTWFVNGVATSAAAARQISADSIASMEVNKVEGRSRISITTKSAARLGFANSVVRMNESARQFLSGSAAKTSDTVRVLRRRVGATGDTVAFAGQLWKTAGSVAEPIVVIDGLRSDASALRKLDRTRIDKVDVLKGELATKMYGADGKNGVIVVTTKP